MEKLFIKLQIKYLQYNIFKKYDFIAPHALFTYAFLLLLDFFFFLVSDQVKSPRGNPKKVSRGIFSHDWWLSDHGDKRIIILEKKKERKPEKKYSFIGFMMLKLFCVLEQQLMMMVQVHYGSDCFIENSFGFIVKKNI